MTFTRRILIPAVVASLFSTAPAAHAQIGGGGSIQGTVLDGSGAAVPGATVTATNLATGVATTRVTTQAGVYALSPLPAGEYRVDVTLDGFRPFKQERVVVDALGVVGLNVTLEVGALQQEVTVSAVPPLLSTGDARLGQTIQFQRRSAAAATAVAWC